MSVVEKEKNNLDKEEKIVTALSKKLNKKVNIQRKKDFGYLLNLKK